MSRLSGLHVFAGLLISVTPSTATAQRSCGQLIEVSADTTIDATKPNAPNVAPILLLPIGNKTPSYPVAQRDAHAEGHVRATFVVDTLGRVVSGSATILDETDIAFGRAVCEYLGTVKFGPPRLNGQKLTVRVVNVPYAFTLRRL